MPPAHLALLDGLVQLQLQHLLLVLSALDLHTPWQQQCAQRKATLH